MRFSTHFEATFYPPRRKSHSIPRLTVFPFTLVPSVYYSLSSPLLSHLVSSLHSLLFSSPPSLPSPSFLPFPRCPDLSPPSPPQTGTGGTISERSRIDLRRAQRDTPTGKGRYRGATWTTRTTQPRRGTRQVVMRRDGAARLIGATRPRKFSAIREAAKTASETTTRTATATTRGKARRIGLRQEVSMQGKERQTPT